MTEHRRTRMVQAGRRSLRLPLLTLHILAGVLIAAALAAVARHSA